MSKNDIRKVKTNPKTTDKMREKARQAVRSVRFNAEIQNGKISKTLIIALMEATGYFFFNEITDDGRVIFFHEESKTTRQIKAGATIKDVQNLIYEFAFWCGEKKGKNEIQNNIKITLGII